VGEQREPAVRADGGLAAALRRLGRLRREHGRALRLRDELVLERGQLEHTAAEPVSPTALCRQASACSSICSCRTATSSCTRAVFACVSFLSLVCTFSLSAYINAHSLSLSLCFSRSLSLSHSLSSSLSLSLSFSLSLSLTHTHTHPALMTKVLKQREECLTKPSQQEILEYCKSHSPSEDSWYFSSICVKPWLSGFSLKNDTVCTCTHLHTHIHTHAHTHTHAHSHTRAHTHTYKHTHTHTHTHKPLPSGFLLNNDTV